MVVNEIMEGVRPKKRDEAKRLGFSDELWRTVELCWQEDHDARPSVEEILFSSGSPHHHSGLGRPPKPFLPRTNTTVVK
jgi:hypothetical protein